MIEKTAEYINILSRFLGKRDISSLEKRELQKKYGIEKADVMVLFGGSILAGGDVLAQGIKNNIAEKYVIVGGAGHTTDDLRRKMKNLFPDIDEKNMSEAELFDIYLKKKYNLKADFLECKSTNCGNNITYMLDLLKEKNISFKNIILSQDASMQCRMEAGLKKYIEDVEIINYAVYQNDVCVENSNLIFKEEVLGMWNMERYISLIMGEIPRLNDDKEGYGPKGKNFIAHVDIPENVMNAFNELKKFYSHKVRKANPIYSS